MYADAFEEAGIKVSGLRDLSNTTIKQLVPTQGHMRRIVRRRPWPINKKAFPYKSPHHARARGRP